MSMQVMVDGIMRELSPEEEFARKSTKVNAVISTVWTGDTVPYKQTIAVDGVTSTNAIDVKLPVGVTLEQLNAYCALRLVDGGQASGQITLAAYGELNTIAIPIEIIVRGDL